MAEGNVQNYQKKERNLIGKVENMHRNWKNIDRKKR